MPYGGIVNNGLYRVSSATASIQREVVLIDGASSTESDMRTVGLTKLIVNVRQLSGALPGTVTVRGRVSDGPETFNITIDAFALPAVGTSVHRSYDIPGVRSAAIGIANPLGAGQGTYSYMLGAGI